jgi:hypothetical protein
MRRRSCIPTLQLQLHRHLYVNRLHMGVLMSFLLGVICLLRCAPCDRLDRQAAAAPVQLLHHLLRLPVPASTWALSPRLHLFLHQALLLTPLLSLLRVHQAPPTPCVQSVSPVAPMHSPSHVVITCSAWRVYHAGRQAARPHGAAMVAYCCRHASPVQCVAVRFYKSRASNSHATLTSTSRSSHALSQSVCRISVLPRLTPHCRFAGNPPIVDAS